MIQLVFSAACSVGSFSFFSVNMNPMKLINMDESMKGMVFLLKKSIVIDVVWIFHVW